MGDNVANEIIGGTNEIIGVVGPIGTIQLSDGQSGLDGSALANVQYGLNYANIYATNFIGNFDGPLILPDPDRGVVFNDGGLSNVAGTFFYNADGSVTINGNLTVTGNTFLDGNVTVIGTENLIIQDPIIEIANTSIDGTSMGLVMQRPSGNVMMAYLSTENSSAYDNTLVFSYTDGSAYGTSLVPGLDPLNVLFTGNVQVGLSSNLLIDVTRSNIIVTSSNVSANYYHGNAYHLVSLTGAAGGTYGGPVDASSSNIAVITVDNTGRITGISNLTVSTELSNLEQVVNRGNVTSNTVQFISAPIAFVTQGGVGIANINPQHTLSVGSNLYVNNTGSNVLTVSGNVSANYYHGNAYHLVSLTDAGSGTYGSGTSVSQVTVDSKGRITNIQDVLITGAPTTSTLQTVINNGNTVTSNTIIYTGTDNFFVSNGAGSFGTTGPVGDSNLYVFGDSNLQGQVIVSSLVEDRVVFVGTGNVLTDSENLTFNGDELFINSNLQVGAPANLFVDVVNQKVGIANINPQHTLSVGSNLYVNDTGSNVLTVSGNVSSNYYHGNAYHLVSLTDAGSGTYGSGTSVSQVTVDSKGRITNIQDVLITGTPTTSNLDIVANNGNVTSNTLQFINAHTAFVTNFTSNIGANIEQLHNVTVTGVSTDQILVYNGNQWENDFPQRTFLMARAGSGETILKGNTVYIIDSYNNNVANVGLANASDPDKMPAVGIAYENFTSSGVHPVVTFGKAAGVRTNGFGEGDTVYVSNLIPGGLTNVKPTGGIFTSNPDLIQNIGFVIKSAVNGVIKVTGVGRSNDIPNANVLPNDNSIQYVYVNTAGNDLKKIDPSLLYTATPTLQQVTDTGNTTTNVVQFQNSTTAFVVTENNAQIKFNSNVIINSNQNRIAIGRQAGQSSQADYAVAIGPFAAYVSQGRRSVAIGEFAGELYQGEKSVAIGTGAGQNSQNTRSVAIGQNAGFYDQGEQSISIGDLAGQLYQATKSIAIGSPAGGNGQNANSIAVGFNAGSNVQGVSSVAIGDQAGQEGQNNYSVAIGYTAGKYGQNTNSVAIGYTAGQNNQQQRSIAIGFSAGQHSLGFDSICIGSSSNARDRSIVLNASGSTLYGSNTNATYISPIRYTQDFVSNVISYVTAQKEVIDSGIITINGSSGTVSITGNLVVSGNTFININANVIPNDSNVKYVYVGTGGNNIEKIDPSKLITGPLTLSVTGIDMFPENNLSTITTTSNNYGGGVLAPNGKIYYIPLNASNVGVMDPSDNSFTTILSSETALSSSLKYNGGILAPNGKIYCIPFNASNVGVIDPRTDSFTTISGPNLATQKYVGGVLAPNGNVYCIPFNASNVGVINTNNDSFTTILSAETALSSANKYAGGVLAPTGNVYCVPYNSSNVGIIDPINHTFTTILSSESALSSTDKYAGGVLAPNGKIYCVPFNSSNVGVIDPFNGSLTIISISDAGNEKYYGGALAPNGKIYCVPYNASNVGVVDPITNTFDVITGLTSSLNKYVGGVVAPNGKIYCVPFDQTNTLVIKTGIPSEGSWILQPEFNKL